MRLKFGDTLRELFCLSDQSALIDMSSEEIPYENCANPHARDQDINQTNPYENEMDSTYRDLAGSGASPVICSATTVLEVYEFKTLTKPCYQRDMLIFCQISAS